MPVRLCWPSRIASISGYVNPSGGFSPGLVPASATTSLGLVSPGTGLSNAELIQEKIGLWPQMPTARGRIEVAGNPGALEIIRALTGTSYKKEVIPHHRTQFG